MERKLLVVDSHYSLQAIRERGLEDSITCRDLGGFFGKVWSVHPFASIVMPEEVKYGRSEFHSLNFRHVFIEGKIGRYPMLRRWPTVNFLFSQIGIMFTLVSLIRKEKISVIRADEPQYNGLLGWVLSRLCGIPLLVRVGNNHDKDYKVTGRMTMPRLFKTRRIEKMCERFVLSRAEFVAGANQDNLGFALRNGAQPEKSTIFRYGNLIARQHYTDPSMRLDGSELLRELGVESGRFLLTIARLESLKHPDHVVRVLARVRQGGENIKAVMVGDGQLRQELLVLARELEVEEHVVLPGNKDQDWLARIIPNAGVVVSPFMGRALTEAALGAVPIVAYDIDWQAELIQTGVTGELVPHLEWERMAVAVERFLRDPAYAKGMGNAVRKRVLEMMSPDALDQNERDTYQKLIIANQKVSQ